MEELSDKLKEPKSVNKKSYWTKALGVAAASSIGLYILSGFVRSAMDGADPIESVMQFNLVDALISAGVGALMGIANYSINKTKDELGVQIKTCKIKYDKDSILVDIIEGKSKLSELEQKKILLAEFYNTLPGNWGLTDFNLDMVIVHEGWGKKPVKSMVKYYAPSVVYNLKNMGRLKGYSAPYFG